MHNVIWTAMVRCNVKYTMSIMKIPFVYIFSMKELPNMPFQHCSTQQTSLAYFFTDKRATFYLLFHQHLISYATPSQLRSNSYKHGSKILTRRYGLRAKQNNKGD